MRFQRRAFLRNYADTLRMCYFHFAGYTYVLFTPIAHMITIYFPGKHASNHMPEEYMKGNYESVIRNAAIAKILYLNKSIKR